MFLNFNVDLLGEIGNRGHSSSILLLKVSTLGTGVLLFYILKGCEAISASKSSLLALLVVFNFPFLAFKGKMNSIHRPRHCKRIFLFACCKKAGRF